MRTLLYHRIVPAADHGERFCVSLEGFERQMHALERRGWRGGSIGEAAGGDGQPLENRRFALTFDDGYEDFERLALPVLERCGFTATVFVVTGYVGGTADWGGGPGIPLLGWTSIRDLRERGIEFGSHTRTHPHLADLPPTRAREEMRGSRKELEDHLGSRVRWLAYPYGESDRGVRELAREAGYEDAFGVLPRRPGPYNRPRVECGDSVSRLGMTLRISRWYPVASRLLSKSHGPRS